MSLKRNRWTVGILSVVVLVSATAAQADIWMGLGRGLELFDYQFSGERNILGNGWTINASAFYNNRTFDFGLADVTLTGPSLISVGYTLRGIPSATFDFTSAGQSVSYNFNINTGLQDFNATGRILYNVSTDVNILGFYDTQIQLSNRGTYSTDGFGMIDDGTLDYDIGPIDVSGNIFADMVAAVLQPLYTATGTENPFAKFSGKATRTAALEATTAELRSRIEAGEILSDEEMATLVNNTITAALLNSQSIDDGIASLSFLDAAVVEPMTVPEPASLMLLSLGGLLLRRPRRRA